MRHIIHVNQHNIKHNAKTGDDMPVLTCKTYLENKYGHTAELWYNGEKLGEFRYEPDDPLSCGAKVWFETEKLEVKVKCRELVKS